MTLIFFLLSPRITPASRPPTAPTLPGSRPPVPPRKTVEMPDKSINHMKVKGFQFCVYHRLILFCGASEEAN